MLAAALASNEDTTQAVAALLCETLPVSVEAFFDFYLALHSKSETAYRSNPLDGAVLCLVLGRHTVIARLLPKSP